MIYNEEQRDLFTVPCDYTLCHCISADLAMGAGIAVKFSGMGVRDELLHMFPDGCEWKGKGFCVCTSAGSSAWKRCANLITKENYWHKPTNETLRQSLMDLKEKILRGEEGNKLAMPLIGCGLDKLEWNDVSLIIKETFSDTGTEILVCVQKR